jgi:hypothetical protein
MPRTPDETTVTDEIAVGRLTSVDAFDRDEELVDLLPGEEPKQEVAFPTYNVPATLTKIDGTAASNGNNQTLSFECSQDFGAQLMLVVGGTAFEVAFDKVDLGMGATIKGVNSRGGADGVTRCHFNVAFPWSEAPKVARAWTLLNSYGILSLTVMQGSLKLADGREVDLTKRAD